MNLGEMSITIEPIRFKLWQNRLLSNEEKTIIDEALKKQIPKKPIIDYIGEEYGEFDRPIPTCECGNIYLSKGSKGCPECLQRLDWSKWIW